MTYSAKFVEEWGQRVGRPGAVRYFWATRLVGGAGVFCAVWISALGAGLASNQTLLKGLGWGLLGLDILIGSAGLVLGHLAFREMSKYLGVHVSALNSPTFREKDFRRWCHRNGLEVPD